MNVEQFHHVYGQAFGIVTVLGSAVASAVGIPPITIAEMALAMVGGLAGGVMFFRASPLMHADRVDIVITVALSAVMGLVFGPSLANYTEARFIWITEGPMENVMGGALVGALFPAIYGVVISVLVGAKTNPENALDFFGKVWRTFRGK